MSWTVKCLVLPLVLLCLWRLQEGAQACKCVPVHPQTAFCQADFVIKAAVLAKKVVGVYELKYDIKLTKMFKGPHRDFNAIYTPASSAACGVTLINGVEYLITGNVASDGSLHVIVCNFVAPWDRLSACQKTSLVERYQKGCDCQITRCHTIPCKISPDECLWTDFLTNLGNREQARHFACQRIDGSCAWIRGSTATSGYQAHS
ncbi:metalloproteinase inhibitor 2-like [Dunckerocampus dactyliophorus]|uniref:metalloproteinase inhibitor 2-like n=1 Tax=Dunckerocampus dactyliophorus TaxID=161453 RepID=UPI002405A7C6|nr:metalloproteinase inhibitor 2-like [Dunckerocampus dactyliophorus]